MSYNASTKLYELGTKDGILKSSFSFFRNQFTQAQTNTLQIIDVPTETVVTVRGAAAHNHSQHKDFVHAQKPTCYKILCF